MLQTRQNQMKNNSCHPGIIVKTQPSAVISEQFRAIRTNIQYSMVDKPLKSIVITSTRQGAGKSFFAANLAATLALESKRVLLVDADLRKPTVHRIFNFKNYNGLTTLLAHPHLPIKEMILSAPVPYLDILTSGSIPPNPAELLATKRMDEIKREMETEYDLVIFDMPPVLPVVDAQIMAGKTDGTIFVISKGETLKEEAMRSKKMMEMVGANVLGAVVNRVEPTKDSYYYGEKTDSYTN